MTAKPKTKRLGKRATAARDAEVVARASLDDLVVPDDALATTADAAAAARLGRPAPPKSCDVFDPALDFPAPVRIGKGGVPGAEPVTPKRRGRIPAAAVAFGGFVFDSRAECRRFTELRWREQAGEVADLQVHPAWDLVVFDAAGTAHHVGVFTADFRFRDVARGVHVVEDVKGGAPLKDSFPIRCRLLLACHRVHVEVVRIKTERAPRRPRAPFYRRRKRA